MSGHEITAAASEKDAEIPACPQTERVNPSKEEICRETLFALSCKCDGASVDLRRIAFLKTKSQREAK